MTRAELRREAKTRDEGSTYLSPSFDWWTVFHLPQQRVYVHPRPCFPLLFSCPPRLPLTPLCPFPPLIRLLSSVFPFLSSQMRHFDNHLPRLVTWSSRNPGRFPRRQDSREGASLEFWLAKVKNGSSPITERQRRQLDEVLPGWDEERWEPAWMEDCGRCLSFL